METTIMSYIGIIGTILNNILPEIPTLHTGAYDMLWKSAVCVLSKWRFPKIEGPQYRPQYSIILIMGVPENTSNLGKTLNPI